MDGRRRTARVAAAADPPGPARSLRTMLIYGPGRNPLAFFTGLKQQYGDVVLVQMAGERVYLVSDPRIVRDILVTDQHKFMKGRGLERAKRLLGEGLLTSEGAMHVRQRRLVQPAFHRDRIAGYAAVMTSHADRLRHGWIDGSTIDASQEMTKLTLGIVGKTLFDADVESHARDVGAALSAVMESFWMMMLPFVDVLERLPIPAMRRSRDARQRLDDIIYRMIADRRRAPGDRGDLLSMLLLAQDDEAVDARGGGMTDAQVRDEAMTLFLAGHETTANALSWTWYLLGRSPEVERKFHDEIDRVLQGRLPTVDDIQSLPYVQQVVTEAVRLYPPAWLIGRRALENYPIGDYRVPARSLVLLSPYLIQRDARHYPEPERFHPERWTPAFKTALPQFAYLPFGGGARRCIGDSFAWMELVLVATTIAQQWRLTPVPDHPVVPHPVVTLRMKHGLKVRLARRSLSFVIRNS